MTDTPDERPRPTPRPAAQRPAAPVRPSPRPRVAGSRRDHEEAAAAADSGRRIPGLLLVLALLCTLVAAGAGVLLWQRLNPSFVDTSVLGATRSGVQALYAYDYRDPERSVARKLEVLTGDLREQYETDLSSGRILETYEQVSATTSYEVVDVGLQRINEAQDTATLVVFGQYVVESATTGEQPAPEGSECEVTPEGAQSCTQTVKVVVVQVDVEWKIDEVTLLTTS